MITLAIWAGTHRVGTLSHDTSTGLYDFAYADAWVEQRDTFPLSPQLPMHGLAPLEALPPERRSTIVRSFFQNLLPEGQALEVAAQSNGISKANLAGLLVALGSETAGALRVTMPDEASPHSGLGDRELRPLPLAELSARIRQRDGTPFAVWDGKVRLSIAGLQDKIAVYEKDEQLSLASGERLASTAILKPAPNDPRFIDLPLVEHTCMRLANALGIEAATTRLLQVPEPVLLVERFDRLRSMNANGADLVDRLHIVDACQAIGLGPEAKYERLYGDSEAVKNHRDGANLRQLFGLAAATPTPLRTRSALLDRVIFNVLIGNSDAHGKNWSFFVERGNGLLRLAPAYDLVDVEAFADANMSTTFAMGIGDAFSLEEVTAFELACMAKECGITRPQLADRIKHLAWAAPKVLRSLHVELVTEGVRNEVLQGLTDRLQGRCIELEKHRPLIRSVPKEIL